MEEAGVPIDAVAGASIGAVIGGVIATGIPPEERAAFVADAFHDLLDYTLPIVALLRSEKITANIEREFGSWQIENTWLPFTCVTTNLTTASIKIHDSGSLSHAVRASVAIPGVLPPVTSDGELLVDGGVLENLPIDGFVNDDRIGTIIVLDVAPPEHPKTKRDFSPDVPGLSALRARLSRGQDNYPTIASTIIRSLLVAASRQRDGVLASGHVDLYVLMNMEDVGLLDFEQVPQVAAAGYEAALPQVRAWVDQRN